MSLELLSILSDSVSRTTHVILAHKILSYGDLEIDIDVVLTELANANETLPPRFCVRMLEEFIERVVLTR